MDLDPSWLGRPGSSGSSIPASRQRLTGELPQAVADELQQFEEEVAFYDDANVDNEEFREHDVPRPAVTSGTDLAINRVPVALGATTWRVVGRRHYALVQGLEERDEDTEIMQYRVSYTIFRIGGASQTREPDQAVAEGRCGFPISEGDALMSLNPPTLAFALHDSNQLLYIAYSAHTSRVFALRYQLLTERENAPRIVWSRERDVPPGRVEWLLVDRRPERNRLMYVFREGRRVQEHAYTSFDLDSGEMGASRQIGVERAQLSLDTLFGPWRFEVARFSHCVAGLVEQGVGAPCLVMFVRIRRRPRPALVYREVRMVGSENDLESVVPEELPANPTSTDHQEFDPWENEVAIILLYALDVYDERSVWLPMDYGRIPGELISRDFERLWHYQRPIGICAALDRHRRMYLASVGSPVLWSMVSGQRQLPLRRSWKLDNDLPFAWERQTIMDMCYLDRSNTLLTYGRVRELRTDEHQRARDLVELAQGWEERRRAGDFGPRAMMSSNPWQKKVYECWTLSLSKLLRRAEDSDDDDEEEEVYDVSSDEDVVASFDDEEGFSDDEDGDNEDDDNEAPMEDDDSANRPSWWDTPQT